MQTSHDIHGQVEEALAKLSTLVSQRDLAVLSEFTSDALLAGSEAGEVAQGESELATFFQHIFARPVRFSWEWQHIRASCEGDFAWFFAEGQVVMTSAEEEKRAPYRVSGVLQRQGGQWVWRQFHGSEPTEG